MPRVLAFLAACLLLASLGGCGGRATLPHRSGPISSLNWTVVGQSPTSLDPALASSPAAVDLASLLYEGLVTLDAKLRVVPAAAASWHVLNHGQRYVFHLRPGLRFSNGNRLTPADVVGSFRRAQGTSGLMGSYLSEVSLKNGVPNVYAASHDDVGFILSHPSPEFLAKLTFAGAGIVDMSTVRRYGQVWTSHADGLGPFKLVQWTPGGRISLAPNPFFPRRPRLKHLNISFASATTAINDFQDGSAGVVSMLSPSRKLIQHFGPAAQTGPTLGLDYVAINTRGKDLKNQSLRRALALAVNRSLLVHRVFGMSATPTASVVPSDLLPGVPGEGYEPKEAPRQLGASGHPKGAGLREFRMVIAKTAIQTKQATILSRMWQRHLGIRVKPIALSATQYLAAIRRRKFDLALVQWGAQYPDAANFLDTQLSTGAPDNLSGWSNPRYDQLISASRRQPHDSAERRHELLQAADIADVETPWIPLDNPTQMALVKSGASALTLTPIGLMGWARLGGSARARPKSG